MKDIATISKTNEILEKYQIKAKKGYGQNFLIEPSIVKKIASSCCDKNIMTLEIGPGIGALSQQLLRYSLGLIAYEIDDKLIPILKEEFKDENFILHHCDILKADLSYLKNQEIIVCANLPYYITTPILFKLALSNLNIKSINVMMQKEIALRIQAQPNDADYGSLSVIMQYLFDTKKLMNIPRTVFNPKPKVDSVVLSFYPKKTLFLDREAFFEFVYLCFKQRRKTLMNNLKNTLDDELLKILDLEFSLNKRAQELSVDEFVRMYQIYANKMLCQD